ncbi:hypothetical protein DL765_007469 [Monosporascus sp. GIB2]|nr:hypothetical protein DL765_007469 [Monosporascus sp. GIB2]
MVSSLDTSVSASSTVSAIGLATVTPTVAYTTLDLLNPAAPVAMTFCSTVVYQICGRASETMPGISTTTVMVSCNACGAEGEHNAPPIVPVALVSS